MTIYYITYRVYFLSKCRCAADWKSFFFLLGHFFNTFWHTLNFLLLISFMNFFFSSPLVILWLQKNVCFMKWLGFLYYLPTYFKLLLVKFKITSYNFYIIHACILHSYKEFLKKYLFIKFIIWRTIFEWIQTVFSEFYPLSGTNISYKNSKSDHTLENLNGLIL